MVRNLWKHTLHLYSNVYWEEKKYFKLEQDVYDTWVILAAESGEFRYEIGNETGTARQDELVFCPPGYIFKRKALSPLSLHFVSFEFDDDISIDSDETAIPKFKAQPTDRVRVASNFSYLRMLHLAMDPRSTTRKQLILNDLWQLACNDWDTVVNQDEIETLTHTKDAEMKLSIEWIVEKAHTPFSIRDVAKKVGLSPAQFSRRFKKAFRMNPSEFVQTLRIRKAARLLLDTDLTLDQIAERCGYDNGFYLSRVFTRHMNMNPSKYRRENQV